MKATPSTIHCEIASPSIQSRNDLVNIARICAIDTKLTFPLSIEHRSASSISNTSITLTIPVEIALACDAAWRLASRIASFCPNARVCAQILSHIPQPTNS